MEPSSSRDGRGDAAALNRALVEYLKREGHIRSPRVEAAFHAVPRHLFLPGVELDLVYRDEAIATKRLEGRAISSSSQPAIMAIMLEQLELEPSQRVLEIGAGTGYNAALMAHIVGETGQVVSLDFDEDIVESACAHLANAGLERVQVVCADGGFGYPAGAPYDRIILTVGAGDITPAWREQLKPGGRLLLPLSIKGPQKSVAFEKTDDHLVSVSLRDCGFMRLRGAFAEPEQLLQLGPEPGLCLEVTTGRQIHGDTIFQLLFGPHHDQPTTVRVTSHEVWGGLNQWLALREPDLCVLSAEGEIAERGILPCLLEIAGHWKWCSTSGLLGEASLSVLARPPASSPTSASPDDVPFALLARTYGADAALAQRLIEHVTAWEAAGRPSTQGMRILAYATDTDYAPAALEIVVPKRWSRFVLDWPPQ